MTNQPDISFVSRLLLDKEYRILRNLILQLIILGMSVEVFFDTDTPNIVNTSTDRIYSWLGYLLVLNLMLYVNIYVLVPRFLIRNKLFMYLISLFLTVIVSMVIVVVVQSFFYDVAVIRKEPSMISLFLSMTSSFLSIGLIIIGTSTLLLFKHWMSYGRRAIELESATLESELKFLKSQINPHFLFNMLNNANIMAEEDPDVASRILVKLDDLLRYQINDSTRDKVYLSADISFLADFLDLEKTRRDEFDYTISKEGDVNNVMVSPLLFIPFVENAVKHNSDSEKLSYVHIQFKVQDNQLRFVCENSKPSKVQARKVGGLGLVNIQRRLDLLYSNNYSLEVKETEAIYTIYLNLNL